MLHSDSINTLVVEVDTFCSLGCSYCMSSVSKDMRPATYGYDKLHNVLKKFNPVKVILWGGDTLYNRYNILSCITEVLKYPPKYILFTIHCNVLSRDTEFINILYDRCNKAGVLLHVNVSYDFSGKKIVPEILSKLSKLNGVVNIQSVLTLEDLKDVDIMYKVINHLELLKDYSVWVSTDITLDKYVEGLDKKIIKDFTPVLEYIIHNKSNTSLFITKNRCSVPTEFQISVDTNGYFMHCAKVNKDVDIDRVSIDAVDKYDEVYDRISQFREANQSKLSYCINKCPAYHLCFTCPKILANTFKDGYYPTNVCNFYQSLQKIKEYTKITNIDTPFSRGMPDTISGYAAKITDYVECVTFSSGSSKFDYLNNNKDELEKLYGNLDDWYDNIKIHLIHDYVDELPDIINRLRKYIKEKGSYNSIHAMCHNLIIYSRALGIALPSGVEEELTKFVHTKDTRFSFQLLLCNICYYEQGYDKDEIKDKLNRVMEVETNRGIWALKNFIFKYADNKHLRKMPTPYTILVFQSLFDKSLLYQIPHNTNIVKKPYNIINVIIDFFKGKLEHSGRSRQKARLAICNACDRLSSTGQCKECGCFVKVKTKFVKSTCPVNKW